MNKTQLNFRIEEELLKAIKKEAKRHGKNHTQWIIEQCQKGLDQQPLTLEELSDRLTTISDRLTAVENQLKPVSETPPEKTRLTNAQLAREIGINPSTISRWSTGKRKPPEDLQYKFDPALKLWIKDET